MSLVEIQAISKEIVSNIWVGAAVSIIAAGFGAYLGAYLRKRGERKAEDENFSAIREQLRITTRDTEEIKQQLGNHLWRTQQLWSERVQYYGELLRYLHHFRIAIDELSEYFMEPDTEWISDETRGEHFGQLKVDASAACKEVEKLIGPAALFLSPVSVRSLKKLISDHWGLANIDAINTAEYVKGAHQLAIAAYDQVLKEAKIQLGIHDGA